MTCTSCQATRVTTYLVIENEHRLCPACWRGCWGRGQNNKFEKIFPPQRRPKKEDMTE